MRVLLLTPPMTQINTPYPATAYLTGSLRELGYDVVQADPAIELLLKMLSRKGLEEIAAELAVRFNLLGAFSADEVVMHAFNLTITCWAVRS